MEDRMIVPTEARRRGRALLPMVGLLAGLGGVLTIAACDDDDDINLVIPPVTSVVTTFKDSAFNFTTLHTFAMPDTVVHFDPATGTPLPVSRQFDQTILDRVRADFLARGYTEVADPRTTMPDFVVLVGTTATQNYNAYVGYSWYSTWGFYSGWGWYAPGFNTGWGIVYPWYSYVGVTAYDRGTLIVDLIPTVTVNPLSRNVSSAWAGVATALLGLDNINSTTITAAIDQMFALSPYLTATPLKNR